MIPLNLFTIIKQVRAQKLNFKTPIKRKIQIKLKGLFKKPELNLMHMLNIYILLTLFNHQSTISTIKYLKTLPYSSLLRRDESGFVPPNLLLRSLYGYVSWWPFRRLL